ncbi:MAG: N-acetylmuramoyl-L-alanine amidase, partial [Bacteroidetes bacterium]|nr:N-acetylmuramoyl-L-alanine amidase [Bacteroidota bacterium]
MQHITHGPQDPESCIEIPKAYGVMGLTLDGKNYFRNNLKLVSQFSGIDEMTIISDPEKNIMAYAKAYTSVLDLMNIKGNDPSQHVQALVALSELPFDGDLQNDYALNTQMYSVFSFLNNKEYSAAYDFPEYNLDLSLIFGEANYKVLSSPTVIITKSSIKNTKGESYQKSSSSSQIFSTNYGPAIWNPTSCNYSSRNGTAVSAVTIHTVQGNYAGCISWFKNCSAQVSAHYVVRSSDGQITQMVLESNKAWHVGNHNPYTIGIEHEGYINNAAWYTNAMYGSSANLVKDICLSGYGIAPTTCYNGPSCNGGSSSCLISTSYRIKGHQQYSNQAHTDPGINWNWPLYYCLINNCGPGPVATPP